MVAWLAWRVLHFCVFYGLFFGLGARVTPNVPMNTDSKAQEMHPVCSQGSRKKEAEMLERIIFFTFMLPIPDEQQQRSSAFFLPTALNQVCCLYTLHQESLGRFSATCPPTSSHPVPGSGSPLTCLALCQASASKDAESPSLPRATV